MKTWPLVNRICEPCVSVFDPPSYVVATLKKRVRVSAKLAYDNSRESRSLQPKRAARKASKLIMDYVGKRPRRSFRLTPRCIYG